nr:uncharacterized protein LOC109742844 [Aegilops tauschii subsp. strangulata]
MACIVDEVAPETSSWADLASFKLTVWTTNPESIPSLCWLAVPEPRQVSPLMEPTMLQYKVLMHLDAVTDYSGMVELPWRSGGSSSRGQSGLPDSSNSGGGAGPVTMRRHWQRGARDVRGGQVAGACSGVGSRRSPGVGDGVVAGSSRAVQDWRLPPMAPMTELVDVRPRVTIRDRISVRPSAFNRAVVPSKVTPAENVLLRALGLTPDELEPDESMVEELKELFDSPLREQHVRVIAAIFGKSLPPPEELCANNGFAYLPAIDTRGGVLLAWDTTVFRVDNISTDTYGLTGLVHNKDGFEWWITVVYGPQGDELKMEFLGELRTRRAVFPGSWMLLGDFNMILRASEKNNANLNRRVMQEFRSFVDELELKELHMHGRHFTWSNERDSPTLTKIDRVLVSVDCDMANPDCFLQALGSNVSDHAPLHLSTNAISNPKRRFCFELYWAKLDGFEDAVREAWAQEWRQLSMEELWLRRDLKLAVLSLASLERTIVRQRTRIRWIGAGDANTRLFQAVANGRHMKNYIAHVKKGEEIITDQEQKEHVFTEAYKNLLGKHRARDYTLDMDYLGLEAADLEEIWNVIKELPVDQAPGPDGFIRIFYQKAWQIIKHDIMAGVMKLYVGDGRGFSKLNKALITLIPKRPDAEGVDDYRPLSLTHSFAKLFAKALACHARRRMSDILGANQSASISGRCLHDNFLLVRQIARKIHDRKIPGVFLELDITRAFDSLAWPFLFLVLRHKGFSERWVGWIAILL